VFKRNVADMIRTTVQKRKGTIEDALLTSLYLLGGGYYSIDEVFDMRLFSGLVLTAMLSRKPLG